MVVVAVAEAVAVVVAARIARVSLWVLVVVLLAVSLSARVLVTTVAVEVVTAQMPTELLVAESNQSTISFCRQSSVRKAPRPHGHICCLGRLTPRYSIHASRRDANN